MDSSESIDFVNDFNLTHHCHFYSVMRIRDQLTHFLSLNCICCMLQVLLTFDVLVLIRMLDCGTTSGGCDSKLHEEAL